MKKLLLILCSTLAFASAHAQLNEEAVLAHYVLNPYLINPAAAGFGESHLVQMNIKSSWTGFPGAPKTYDINYNGPVGKVLGLGASVRSENVAAFTRTRLQFAFGTRFAINNDFKIGGGIATDLSIRKISNSILDSDFYDEGDAIVESNITGVRYFDVSAGAYATYKEATKVGISLPNIVQSRLNQIQDNPEGIDSVANSLSLLAYIAHELEVGDDLKLEPSVLIRKMENVPFTHIDINILAKFLEERLTAGLTYRMGFGEGGTAAVLLGTKVTAFKIYYSYDVSFQQFQSYNGGIHEITVSFDPKGEDNRSRRKRQLNKRRRR